MRLYPRRLTVVILLSSCVAALAQPVDYSGHKAVRVNAPTAEDVERIQALGGVILNCHIGPGQVDVVLPPDRMDDLDRTNLTYRVMSEDVGPATKRHLQRSPLRGAFDDYMTYSEIVTFINNLATARPDICEVIDIGDSLEGRDIWVLHITGPNPGPKPGVFYHGLQHCREWITGPVVLYLANHLVTNYDTDPCVADLVNRTDFYLAPCVNPDGYVYTWSSNRLWRKNRRNNGDGTTGVDLNRNWAFGWGGEGSSGSTSSETYRGPSPFSEPETQVLSNFVINHPNIIAYMDYHSYSQLILWPFGYISALPPDPDLSAFNMIGLEMQRLIGDVHGEFYEQGPIYTTIYPVSGGSVDWVYGDQGRFGFSIELRPGPNEFVPGFELPPSEILPTCEENLPAILFLSEWSSTGVTVTAPEGLPLRLIAGTDTTVTVTVADAQENYVPGSGALHYRFNSTGDFRTAPLAPVGSDQYEAVIPAGPCGSTVEYFVTANGDGGSTGNLPCAAPDNTYSAPVTDVTLMLTDNFETNNGWTVSGDASDGQWNRGVPVDFDRGDPPADSDGSGQCFLTDNDPGTSNSDVDNGTTILTSPVYDISAGGVLSYDYWVNDVPNGQMGSEDALAVEVATDAAGTNWTELRRYSTPQASWRSDEIAIGSEVPASATIRVRFLASDLTPGNVVEAGIDNLAIFQLGCEAIPGDGDGDGDVDLGDFARLVDCLGGPSGPIPATCIVPVSVFDFDEDLDVDLEDVALFEQAFDVP